MIAPRPRDERIHAFTAMKLARVPEDVIEALIAKGFLPPIITQVEYEIQLNAVAREMACDCSPFS